MTSILSSIPPVREFFPPTPEAYSLLQKIYWTFPIPSVLLWTPLSHFLAMGKNSGSSRFNLPGRYAWAIAELVGPLNLLFILYVLPTKLKPQPQASNSFLGTGLPAQNEMVGCLYVIHYINRAFIAPVFLAPSMSPIHPTVSAMMATFQFINSSCIGSWLTYSTLDTTTAPLVSALSILGLAIFFVGLSGNIIAENALFSLRRGAARRKAKSEGKAVIKYDKVYVIPPAEGLFKYVLYPHYLLEWLEWTGYWIIGGALGLGWITPALWFAAVEVMLMLPQAEKGRSWYEAKFGKRAVARRGACFPLGWL